MNVPYVSQTDIDNVKRLSRKERDNLARRVNATDPTTIFEEARSSSNPNARYIICPKCGNGSGRDKTPVKCTFKKDQWLYYCQRCGDFSGNLLKVIAHECNLNLNTEDFFEALAIAVAFVGENIPDANYSTQHKKNNAKKSQSAVEEKIPAAEYERLAEARNNVDKFFAARADWRGLTKEIFLRLGWGILFDYTHPKVPNKKFAAVIIPNDSNGLLARQIDGDTKSNIVPSATTTIVPPAADKLLFIVEGAIDGASIAHVTNFQHGVIAMGGTNGKDNLIARLSELFPVGTPKPKTILLLDNDGVDPKTNRNPGQDAATQLLPRLRELGFAVVNRVICDEPRIDPNKILVGDGEENLRGLIEKIIEDAHDELNLAVEEQLKNSTSTANDATPNEDTAPTTNDDTTNETDIPAEIKAEIEDWEADNTKIYQEWRLKIWSAIKMLNELTPQNVTSVKAKSSRVKTALAYCRVFDFDSAVECVENFFANLEIAKKAAAAQIKSVGEFAAIDPKVQALKSISVAELRKEVEAKANDLTRQYEKFVRNEKSRAASEAAKQQREAREVEAKNNLAQISELRKESRTPERDAEIVARINEACDWKVDRFGNPVEVKDTAANAELIFGNDPALDGAIGFDEFQQADVILKPLPWHKSAEHVGELFRNRDGAQLRFYLRKTYTEFGKTAQSVEDAVITFSDKRRFHPVKEYFSNLPEWDGKTRAETLFIDFLKVDDTPINREITLNWLIAAVARIYYPGCRYQNALILHGNQGIGKSFVLEQLGGKWHGVISDNVEDSHAIDAIQNLWIGEFREMKGMRKADVNAIKSFIDTAVDNRRPAYGRRSEQTKRHIVFAITVNDPEFLNDPTGNRRFPILECHNERGQWIEGLTEDYIAQVWSEVKVRFKELFTNEDGQYQFNEKKLALSREAKLQVEAVAAKHSRDDGLSAEIQAFLETTIPPRVIWQVLSRDERRKFIAERKFYFAGGIADIESRRRALGGRNVDADIKTLHDIFNNDSNLFFRKLSGGTDAIIVYGAERRQHISAGEILNEAFGTNDRRVSMRRISEIMSALDNWKLGARIQNDSAYRDQKKVYWREEQPVEISPETSPETSTEPQQNCSGTTEPSTAETSTATEMRDAEIIGGLIEENPPF